MKCPYCEKEMISGVVQSARQIFFTTQPNLMWFAVNGDEVMLSSHNWTKPTAIAYHCPDCKKVVVDYSKPID